MIGRNQVAPVIFHARVPVRFSALLLATLRDVAVQLETIFSLEVSGVLPSDVFKLDRPPPGAIKPDGEALIFQFHNLTGGGERTNLNSQKCENKSDQNAPPDIAFTHLYKSAIADHSASS